MVPSKKRRYSSISTPSKTTTTVTKTNAKKPSRYAYKPTKATFGKQLLPKQLFNTLTYVETVNVSLGVTGLGSYLFSCNGMYDPNITSTGHQPRGFDQMMTLYDHYTVLKSRCKMTMVSNGNFPVICSLLQDDDTSIAAPTGYDIWERETCRTLIFNSAAQTAPATLWSFWDGAKVFGGDPQSDPSMQGTSSANPTEQTYYVCYFDGGLAGASGTVTIMVEIKYDVVFDEITSFASS